MLDRRSFLRTFAAMPCLGFATGAPRRAPNVVLILADD
jgi:hypothetical protein